MKKAALIIAMGLVSLNVSFASAQLSSTNEQKIDTIAIKSNAMSNSENNYNLELEQPNVFIDYGIDLSYKGSELAPGVNVGNLPIEVINLEINNNSKKHSEEEYFYSHPSTLL